MSHDKHLCPICGKPTSVWYGNARKDGLCREHAQMLKDGKLIQCPDCDSYHLASEKCKCQIQKYTELPHDGFDTCIICGEETDGYAFCRECYYKYSNEELIKLLNKHIYNKSSKNKKGDIETATTIENENNPPQEITPKKNEIKKGKCLVCKSSINPFSINKNLPFLCSECRKTMEHNIKELDKNQNVQQYKDYYFNLRSNIFRLYGFEEYIKPNIIKLIAIAQACKIYRNSSSLIDRVELDIKEILKSKENEIAKELQTKQEESKIIELNTKNNRGNIRGKDGHFLDSDKEQTIDDILFDLRLPHAIHTNVPKITERTVNADWYIPVIGRLGIYIEYFGMDKPDYKKNREEKIELYQKHNVPLIYILPDELEDTQGLSFKIEQEYNKLKKELKKND